MQDVQSEFDRRLSEARLNADAIILAHNYQPPWVQDIADYLGDSLYLSEVAAAHSASTLVFCGVRFMAETAKLLSPDKTVLLPATDAGCSLADSITPDDLAIWKKEFPEALVVAYVNTSAAVKALADVCCTSSNAVSIVDAIPHDRDVLFLPDFFLGSYVKRMTNHPRLHLWMGECHVHAEISWEHLDTELQRDPDALVYVHPECGCTTPALYQLAERPQRRSVQLLSTGQMVAAAKTLTNERVLVATEIGILHQLRKANPTARFKAVNPKAQCPYMNRVTPESLLSALEDRTGEITLDPGVVTGAAQAVQAMIDPTRRPWEQGANALN
ncbi:MAG: quinolinate synthase NadA [Ferrimicrobium sp.]